MDGKDCCPNAILGVTDDATYTQIRRAYRARLLRAHPDHGGSAAALSQVLGAYETLIAKTPKPLLQLSTPLAREYSPQKSHTSGGVYSALAAKRYAEAGSPGISAARPVADTDEPFTGGFTEVLQRAIHKVERLQVDLLVPSYTN